MDTIPGGLLLKKGEALYNNISFEVKDRVHELLEYSDEVLILGVVLLMCCGIGKSVIDLKQSFDEILYPGEMQ